MGSEERRKKRLARQKLANKKSDLNDDSVPESDQQKRNRASSDNKIAKLLAKNEDDLLNFVVKVNKVYQEKLNRPAPFMTFVICGMQSAGKSTIMERFMNAVLNIIQEGTGTRCPLDTTCIHDDTLTEPTCDLSGEELPPDMSGDGLTIADVFKYITTHNKNLAKEDRFSTKELRLVYRARNVQNMRFVDTPGIISNKGQGKDNREDIQDILRNTMKKPNTKLCVLLEPKEFSTNPIIDFCDTTFSGRKWVEDSIFIMNKFDKQFDDSRSGSKANNFFKEFQENDIFPHLVMTPTLAKEDLPAGELFKERQKLLDSASEKESNNFENWILGHEKFLQSNPDDQLLHPTTKKRIGFETTKNVMREVMLEDTARRLPEVLTSLRKELGDCQNNLKILNEKKRFNDPNEVKLVMVQLLQRVQTRMLAYLDGDLETSVKFPHVLQTLDDELQDEEESEWCNRELNHYTDEEDTWRERLSDLDYPKQIQADKRFHGGKQIHRAIETFGLVMIESLPDPFELKEFVANGAGYLQGGLQRENWERAITAIVKMTVKKTSHPGLNFLIKHVGQIFRRMFSIALEDVKQGEEFSATLKLMPSNVETHLSGKFDEMLWTVMGNAANLSHQALEPMYSTIDPTLPTFHATHTDEDEEDNELYTVENGQYVKTPSKRESREFNMVGKMKEKITALLDLDGEKAKKMLSEHNLKKATEKNHFLPDQRTSMINDEETLLVIKTAFKYIIALMEFNMVILRFQINHYLYEGFKRNLNSWTRDVSMEEDWAKLVKPDEDLNDEICELEGKIHGLQESLHEVQRIQSKF